MLKYLLILFSCSLTIDDAHSQSFGLKGGANVSWIGGDSEEVVPFIRYHLGIVSNVSLIEESLTLQPELYYSAQGTGVQGGGTARYHYLCLPLLAKIEGSKHYFLIGPQGAVLYEANFRYKEAKQNVSAQLNPVDFALVLGGGLKLSAWVNLELRYHHGISDTATNDDGDFPSRLFQLSFTHLLIQP